MTSTFTPQQRDEVMLYVRDERKCLTSRWASRNFGISRHDASLLLQNVLECNDNKDLIFEVIRTCVKETKNKNDEENSCVKRKAVSLVKETVSKLNPSSTSNSGQIYSIALKVPTEDAAPTIQSAHEIDMSNVRDDIQQGQGAFDTDLLTCSIKPADEISMEKSNPDSVRQIRMQTMTNSKNGSTAKSPTSSLPKPTTKIGPPRKVTTAASFFGKSSSSFTAKTTVEKSKTITRTTSKSKIKPSPDQKLKQKPKSKKKKADDFINDDSSVEEQGNSDDDTVSKSASIFEGDEPSSGRKSKRLAKTKEIKSKKKQKPNYGNADDFVGDEDEDEEDEKLDEERKKRIAMEKRKEIRKTAKSSSNKTKNTSSVSRAAVQEERMKLENDVNGQDSDGNESDAEKVYGAMDSFAQKKALVSVSQSSRKRQRKKMVEKTTMDDKGYIHTETVEVWEDVPSDEEVEKENELKSNKRDFPVGKKQKTLGENSGAAFTNKSNGKSAVKKKNTKNMKQAGLMGFFAKK